MPIAKLAVFCGSDEARVAEAALAAARALTPPDAGDFGQDIIDGQAENAEAAERAVFKTIEALQTMPFFGNGKVVWLKNANFLGDSQTGNAQSTVAAVERLGDFLERGLASDLAFVLSASSIDKRRSFYKRLQKLAKIETLDKVDIKKANWERALVPLIQQRARQIGLTLAPDVAEHFIRMVGEDTRRLDSELEKLRTYTGSNSKISVDDIRAVVSKSRGGIVFEIGNAISRRDLASALSLLEHFLDLGESPVGIIRAGIIPQVRQLLVCSDLLENHRIACGNYNDFQSSIAHLPDEATSHLPRAKSGELSLYPMFLACSNASKYSTQELINALDACLEADRCLVNTGLDAALVLSQLLVRVVGKAPKAA